jgi:hypothetical protein
MFHLTLRAAWHENRWDGTVCRNPSRNSFCVALDRIRLKRDDAAEDKTGGRSFGELSANSIQRTVRCAARRLSLVFRPRRLSPVACR